MQNYLLPEDDGLPIHKFGPWVEFAPSMAGENARQCFFNQEGFFAYVTVE